jgi:hypothetical protein
MDITVTLPDGTRATFPQGTSPDIMQNAIRQHLQWQPPAVPTPPERPTQLQMLGDQAADIGQGVMSGAALGATDLAGLPGSMRELVPAGSDLLVRGATAAATLGGGTPPRRASDAEVQAIQERSGIPRIPNPIEFFPTGQQVADFVRRNVGMPAQAQTNLGKIAESGARAIPAGLALGGTAAIVPSAVSGVASETAGQATAGTAYEGAARVGAGLVGGIAASQMARPSYSERMLGNAVGGIDDATAQRATALMRDAEARGVRLTVDEALQAASNGGVQPLTNLRRVVDQSTVGGGTMSRAMAERTPAMEAAARRSVDQIAPPTPNPSLAGPRVQEAADTLLDRARQQGNRIAQPYYDATRTQTVPAADLARLQANPSYARVLNEIRSTDELRPLIGNLPDDSVAVVNEVRKRLNIGADQARGTAMVPGDNQMGMLRGNAARDADNVAASASPEYRQANSIVGQWNRQALDPLRAGPLGAVAAQEGADTASQATRLLPVNPVANSQQETARAIGMLMREAPEDTAQLVRQRVEMPLNARFGNTVGGAQDPFAGARYANDIRGNVQRGQNIDAAVRGVAGQGASDDFARTLDVLRATGARPAAGSMTDFNRILNNEMRDPGGLIAATTGPLRAVRDRYEQMRMGSSSDALARLLLSGEQGVARARELGNAETSRQILARLLAITAAPQPQALPAPQR